jgi:hypothetical protein
MLGTGEKIRLLIKRKNTNITEVSANINTTRQNLTNKLARNNFSETDLRTIAEALGQELIVKFRDKETGEEL